jgi:hypothetical protein
MKTWLQNNRKLITYALCVFFGGAAFRLLSIKSDLAMYSAFTVLAIILFTLYKTTKKQW